MLRRQATIVLDSLLKARQRNTSVDLSSLQCYDFPTWKDTSHLRSLSAWFTDSLTSKAAFSSGGDPDGKETLKSKQTGAKPEDGFATEEEQTVSSSETFADTDPADPYAGLSREQVLEVVAAKDGLIAASSAETAELTERIKRTLADMENLRQRTAKQAETSQKFAIQSFLKSMLDVGDNLERAYGAVPPEALHGKEQDGSSLSTETALSLLKGIVNGVQLTEKIFDQALRENGVEKYRPEGQKFDPNLHEALFELPDPNKEPGTVGAVTKTGYLLNGRVVRPAQVGVVRAQ